jgi:ligand-binding sensor domain-containing protein
MLALAWSCGGSGTQAQKTPATFDVLTGSMAQDALASPQPIDASASVGVLGATKDGHILAVAGDEIVLVDGKALTQRWLYSDGSAPLSIGRINAIAPRAAQGAWIGADGGVFYLDTLYILQASFTTGKGAVRGVTEAPSGPLAGLWLATDDGLFLRSGSSLTELTVQGAQGGASMVAVEDDGSAMLTVIGGKLYLLTTSGSDILSQAPPLDAGSINALAGGKGVLYAATAKGVLRWRADRTPTWTQLSLSTDAMTPASARAMTVDAGSQALWVLTEGGLSQVQGDATIAYAMPSVGTSTAPPSLVADAIGDLWTADPTHLELVTTGRTSSTAVTFAKDVSPWIGKHCAMCHMNQTQNFEDYATFAPLAEMALTRVRMGDMPRCNGGIPCPADQHLQESDYAVLADWIRAGKPE